MQNKVVDVIPIYNSSHDITILLEQTKVNDVITKDEIIGWYHGEPNDEDTKLYSTEYRGKYVAEYKWKGDAIE